MQFNIGTSTVTLEFPDSNDYGAVASLFLAEPTVAEALKAHAVSFAFQSWSNDDRIDQSTINTVIGIALEEGVDKAEDYMIEHSFDTNPSDYFFHNEGRKTTTDLISGFLDTFAREAGILEDEGGLEAFHEAIIDRVIERVEEQMTEMDRSKPSDFFGRGDEVRVAFVQGYGSQGYIDDIRSSHADNTCQTDTVRPDRNLMLQFKLLNISPVEFVEFYKAKRGHDLANPTFGDGVSEYHRRQFIENAQAWRFACAVHSGVDVSNLEIPDWLDQDGHAKEMAAVIRTCRDLDRPSAVSLDTLEDILDNATYGGVGTWYGRVKAREVMNGEFGSSFVATGGQIGVHDFGSGSGYLTLLENEVLIDLRDGKLVGDTRFRNNPEAVYGFTRRALDVETRGTKLEDWVRFQDDTWRSISTAADGSYAEITKVDDIDGDRKMFAVTSKDTDNRESGTFKFSGTLDRVKAYASEFLGQFVLATPSKSVTGPTL
jgi:hypothetical protein